MTDHQSFDTCMQNAMQKMQWAEAQLNMAMRQEHNNAIDYTAAQLDLEQTTIALENMMHNANAEQREQLESTLAQLRRLQHEMIVTPH